MKRTCGWIAAGLMLALLLGGCATETSSGTNTLVLVQEADLAYSQGDWARAESQYRQITQRVPGDAYAWFKLGNLYLHTDRPSEAMYAYQQTLTRDNTNTKAYHNLALLYLLQGQRTLEAGIKAAPPNDPQLLANRAMLAQLSALVAGGPSDHPLNLKAINRATQAPVAPATVPRAPVHTSQPAAASPHPVSAAAAAGADPVIIDIDKAGHAHRITPGALSSNSHDSPADPVIIQSTNTALPSAANADTDKITSETQPGAGRRQLVVLSRSLYMREAPNREGTPVMGLKHGDIVIAVDPSAEAGWRRVRRNGITGWVDASYLGTITPPLTPMNQGQP